MAFIKDGNLYLTHTNGPMFPDRLYSPIEHEKKVIAVGHIGGILGITDYGRKYNFFFINEDNELFEGVSRSLGGVEINRILPDYRVVDYCRSGDISTAITVDNDLLVIKKKKDIQQVLPGHKFVRTLARDFGYKMLSVIALDDAGNLWGNYYSNYNLFVETHEMRRLKIIKNTLPTGSINARRTGEYKVIIPDYTYNFKGIRGKKSIYSFTQITTGMHIVGFDIIKPLGSPGLYLIAWTNRGKLYFLTNPNFFQNNSVHPIIGQVKKAIEPLYEINMNSIIAKKCVGGDRHIFKIDGSGRFDDIYLFVLDESGNLWDIKLHNIKSESKFLELNFVRNNTKSITSLTEELLLGLSDDGIVEVIYPKSGDVELIKNREDFGKKQIDLLPGDALGSIPKRFGKTKSAKKIV